MYYAPYHPTINPSSAVEVASTMQFVKVVRSKFVSTSRNHIQKTSIRKQGYTMSATAKDSGVHVKAEHTWHGEPAFQRRRAARVLDGNAASVDNNSYLGSLSASSYCAALPVSCQLPLRLFTRRSRTAIPGPADRHPAAKTPETQVDPGPSATFPPPNVTACPA